MPRRSSSASMCSASRPPMVIFPDVGSTIRLIIRMVVVFPQPDGPTNTTILPAGMTMLNSSTAAAFVFG